MLERIITLFNIHEEKDFDFTLCSLSILQRRRGNTKKIRSVARSTRYSKNDQVGCSTKL